MLLTDVTMPKMGGLELAGRVLGMNTRPSVVFMSGGAWRAQDWSAHWGLNVSPNTFGPGEPIETVRRVLTTNAQSQKGGRRSRLVS
jgi:CheY-like chemotaxis protein